MNENLNMNVNEDNVNVIEEKEAVQEEEKQPTREEMIELLEEKMNGIHPLKVIQIDYSDDPEVNRHEFFDEETLKILHKKEYLARNIVKVPVYHNETQFFFSETGKFIKSRTIHHGIFVYTIIMEYGENHLNDKNESFIQEDQRPKKEEVHIYYDREAKRYKVCPDDEEWKTIKKEAEKYTKGKWLYNLFWDYADFLKNMWKKKRFIFPIGNQTHEDVKEILKEIDSGIQILRDFHKVAKIMGYLSEREFQIIETEINTIEKSVNLLFEFLDTQVLKEKFNSVAQVLFKTDKKLQNEPSVILKSAFEQAFVPGYYIDPFKELLFPNMGQFYALKQKAPFFRTKETIKTMMEDEIQTALNSLNYDIAHGKADPNNLSNEKLVFKNVPTAPPKKKR